MTSQEAELVVDLLEWNYRRGDYGIYPQDRGIGLDLAAQIRDIFGMTPQTEDDIGHQNSSEASG